MKIFTKSVLVAIAMMAGVTTVSAQEAWQNPEEWVELTADMWHQWGSEADPTHCKKDAVITGDMTPAWNLNSDIGAGACIQSRPARHLAGRAERPAVPVHPDAQEVPEGRMGESADIGLQKIL